MTIGERKFEIERTRNGFLIEVDGKYNVNEKYVALDLEGVKKILADELAIKIKPPEKK